MTSLATTLFSATLGEDGRTEPPLGLLYIAAALERMGCQLDFRDFQLYPGASIYDIDAMCCALGGHESVLMISCFVDMLPIVLAATKRLKESRPHTYILLGGPGATAKAHELMVHFDHLDAIVLGEGEATIQEWVVRYTKSGGVVQGEIAGMIHRDRGRLIAGPERPRLEQNAIGMPAFHLLDWTRYVAARIVTTRGCPYHCSFCDVAPLWGRRATYRDLHSTVEEIIELKDRYGVTDLAIADDTFVLNRDRVKQFCSILIDKHVEINWGCFGRINLMSEDLIELMAEAGCKGIFYGIDSGSKEILKQTSKELDAEAIVPILRLSAKYFEFIEASFIWGYPTETLEDFRATLDIAAQASLLAPKVNVQLHLLSPLPSSPMYRNFDGSLLQPEARDKRWLLLPGVMLDPRAEELKGIVLRNPDLFPRFFCFPTLDKNEKISLLEEVVQSIEETIGRAVIEPSVSALLSGPSRQIELELLAQADTSAELIGRGLAVVLLQRARNGKTAAKPRPIIRQPGFARRRQDTGLVQII
jgi:anaerobic magnesium-protoporphyrin IX monomethyl ester cyclase